jgi:hypothetical protein
MKIHEHSAMVKYLTRPGKVLANNINNKMSKTDEYNTYFNKNSPKYYKRTPMAKGKKPEIKPEIKAKVSKPSDMLKYIEHSVYAYGDGPKPKNFDEKYLDKILNNPKLAMSETPEEEAEMLLGGEALEFMKWLKDNPDGTYNDWLKDKTASKSNGHYKPPHPPKDSFDWDLWLRERPNYKTLEDEETMKDFIRRVSEEKRLAEINDSGITQLLPKSKKI